MTPLEDRKRKLTNGIFSLFFSWLIAVGCLDAILLFGLFISKKWLPLVVFGIMLLVMSISRSIRHRGTPWCYRVPAMTIATLFISAVIMMVINLFGVNMDPKWVKPQPHNELIPYVSTLIIYPVACFCALWYLVIGRRAPACVRCQIRNGSYTERGLISKLFNQESTLQLKFMFVMSGIILVVDWMYYYLYYINVNLNSPDLFFFFWIPTVLTILSVIFFFTRYSAMWRHYCHNPSMDAIHGNSTALRFLVIVGDHILLDHYNGMIVDTPFKCFVPFTPAMNKQRALEAFRQLSGLNPPRMEEAYDSEETTTLANSFHYLCYFDNINELQGSKIPGQLYTMNRVLKMVKEKLMAPELRSELERIYTVAIAWKTYTVDGKRKYPVKNYRPSFRFRDLPTYDVDYNDKRWLGVTVNNEDKRFFKIRRFWNKVVHGIR